MQEHQRLHGKPLYVSSAQLTVQHTKEEVNGKNLLTVANFPRKQIGPRMSDCLITGVQVNSSEESTRKASTVMVQCSHAVQPGMLITVTGTHLFELVEVCHQVSIVCHAGLMTRCQLSAVTPLECMCRACRAAANKCSGFELGQFHICNHCGWNCYCHSRKACC